MKNKSTKIIFTALCGLIFSFISLNAQCPEKTHDVQGIERHLEIVRGSVFNESLIQIGGPSSGGEIIEVEFVPLRPKIGNPGLGFSTVSSIRNFTMTNQIRIAAGGNLAQPQGLIRTYIVTVHVTFDCPFALDPTVVASLENHSPTTIATANVAVGSFGLFVNNVTRNGFSADIVFEVYGDTTANINNLVALLLTPAEDNGGGIAFNFIAMAPKS